MQELSSVKKQYVRDSFQWVQGRVGAVKSVNDLVRNRMIALYVKARAKVFSEVGQGTTEYAILVGVLVVIAIVAITLFKPKIEELWNAIAVGINGL